MSDDPQVPSTAEAGSSTGAEPPPEEPGRRLIRRGGPAPSAATTPGTPGAATPDTPGATTPAAPGARSGNPPRAMIPARGTRPLVESVLMRIIATAGVIGISVAIAAIMGAQHSKAWLIGLVTSVVSVLLAAVLWSSQRL